MSKEKGGGTGSGLLFRVMGKLTLSLGVEGGFAQHQRSGEAGAWSFSFQVGNLKLNNPPHLLYHGFFSVKRWDFKEIKLSP